MLTALNKDHHQCGGGAGLAAVQTERLVVSRPNVQEEICY